MIPLKDDAPRIGTPFINYILIVLNIVAFLFEISLNSTGCQQLVYAFGVVPARFTVVLFNHGYVPWNLISDWDALRSDRGGLHSCLHLQV